MKVKPRAWTTTQLRDLLKGYLTDPDFAVVRLLPNDRMSVQLPDGGGRFIIAVSRPK